MVAQVWPKGHDWCLSSSQTGTLQHNHAIGVEDRERHNWAGRAKNPSFSCTFFVEILQSCGLQTFCVNFQANQRNGYCYGIVEITWMHAGSSWAPCPSHSVHASHVRQVLHNSLHTHLLLCSWGVCLLKNRKWFPILLGYIHSYKIRVQKKMQV